MFGRIQKPVNDGTFWNWDAIDINTEAKTLSVKRRSLFNNNNAIEFSLDGWTGRYGMPVEFLLSVHKATMMPDLAMDMVTNFPTEIMLLFHDVGGSVKAGYRVGGNLILYEDFSEAVTNIEREDSDNAFVKWLKDLFEDISMWLSYKGHKVQCAKDVGVDVGTFDESKGCTCEPQAGKGDSRGYRVVKEGGKWVYAATNVKYDEETGEVLETYTTKGEEYTGTLQDIQVVYKPCDRCKGIVDAIISKLGKNQDYNFKAYTPYIAQVTDHWYRDVYFVINKSGDEHATGDLDFVEVDYDYQTLVQERWTLYETYTDKEEDKGTYKYNPEKAGEFIIFEIDEDGKYKKNGSEYVIFDGEFQDARPTLVFEKVNGEYVEYTGSRVDVSGKDLYRYDTNGDFVKYTGDVAVAKKAITFDITEDTETLEDYNWHKNSSSVWSAYKEGDTSSTFEPLFTEEEIAKEDGEWTKHVMKNAYVKMELSGNIIQTGEGQRTETNEKIKKMFLQNNYFVYKGDAETAEAITDLREKIADKRGKSKSRYGPLSDEELELSYNLDVDDDGQLDKNVDGTLKDYKVASYAGKVTLNQDSLNAFSMLENTHTLDSDYIYRDFKELIVELGYFTKEEVTGFGAKRVMQWVVPDIGSYLYPKRSIDKIENEYGSMVHSKGDIDANEKNTMKALIANMEREGGAELTGGTGNTDPTSGVTPIGGGTPKLQSGMLDGNSSISIDDVGAMGAPKSPKTVPLSKFIKTTEEMCLFMDSVGYDYCVNRPVLDKDGNKTQSDCTCTDACIAAFPTSLKCTCGDSCDVNHCAHTVHQNDCDLRGTYEASLQDPVGSYNCCCNFLVRWALLNVGVYTEASPYAISSMPDYMIDQLDGEKIEPGEPLKPGDICFYRNYAHVDIVAEVNGGSFYKFNAGHPIQKGASKGDGGSSINTFDGWSDSDAPDFAIRLPWGGSSEPAKYEGYNGNEAVVSPVTGILLEYDTYTTEVDSLRNEEYRVNVDLYYGKDKNVDIEKLKDPSKEPEEKEEPATVIDKVGYAKILVLDPETYQRIEAATNSKWKNDSLVKIVEHKVMNKDDKDQLKEDVKKNIIFRDYENADGKFNVDDLEDWSEIDKTIYGYKEFAELYYSSGIAGNIIYIDGFVLEKPDESLPASQEEADEADIEMMEQLPNGEKLDFNKFKIKPSQLESNSKDDSKKLLSRYEAGVLSALDKKSAMEKAEANLEVKAVASEALNVTVKNEKGANEDLVIIKEGTVLGRTMTDKELIEKVRVNPPEDYKAYRPDEEKDANGKIIDNARVMGNYLRFIMRDLDGTVVENAEDYMKLDELIAGSQEYQFREGDLEILADAICHEGCGHYCANLIGGTITDDEKLYLSKSTGYTIINKLNSDSGFKPDYNDPSKLWDPQQSPLYNLVCRIPDRDDLLAQAASYGFTTGIGKGWYAIAPGIRHRIETDSLKYCDTCMEAAEYIRDNDSRNMGNNGKFGATFMMGEEMPHTMWEQGGNYYGNHKLWLYIDKNKNGVKDNGGSGDYYLFDTVD